MSFPFSFPSISISDASIGTIEYLLTERIKLDSCQKRGCTDASVTFSDLLAVDVSMDNDTDRIKLSGIPDIVIFSTQFKLAFIITYSNSHFTVIYKDKAGIYWEYNDVPKSISKCRKDMQICPQFLMFRKIRMSSNLV